MKVLKVIKKTIFFVVSVVVLLFAILMTVLVLSHNKYGVTEFEDKSLILVNDKLSSEKYNDGDLVITNKVTVENVKLGQELFAYKVIEGGSVNITVGMVGEIYVEDNTITFENGENYTMDYVAGEAYKTYPKIGGYLALAESKWIFLGIVVVPVFFILISRIYALIVEIKYGGDDKSTQAISNIVDSQTQNNFMSSVPGPIPDIPKENTELNNVETISVPIEQETAKFNEKKETNDAPRDFLSDDF